MAAEVEAKRIEMPTQVSNPGVGTIEVDQGLYKWDPFLGGNQRSSKCCEGNFERFKPII